MKNTILFIAIILSFNSCFEIYDDLATADLEVSETTFRNYTTLMIEMGQVNDTIYAQGYESCHILIQNKGMGTAYNVEYEITRTPRFGKSSSESFFVGEIDPKSEFSETIEYDFAKLDETASYEVVVYWD